MEVRRRRLLREGHGERLRRDKAHHVPDLGPSRVHHQLCACDVRLGCGEGICVCREMRLLHGELLLLLRCSAAFSLCLQEDQLLPAKF
jgi:hypothetical protein